MTESQQFELGSYVNLMESATMLLVNPILGLQPKYTEQDFEKCAHWKVIQALTGLGSRSIAGNIKNGYFSS